LRKGFKLFALNECADPCGFPRRNCGATQGALDRRLVRLTLFTEAQLDLWVIVRFKAYSDRRQALEAVGLRSSD
jgi:hypothetical protein